MAATGLSYASSEPGRATDLSPAGIEAFGAGRNTEGQLADAQIIPSRPYPMPTVSGVTYAEITVGTDHACGLTPTGEAYCWGGNYYGQLGNSDVPWINDDFHPPSLVMAPGGATWSAVSAGYRYTCGVTADGRGHCWGWNNNTRLATIDTGSLVRVPSEVRGGSRWRSIDSGYQHTCGVTTGGVVLCWGYNFYGQLGSGTSLGAYLSPTTVSAATGLAHGSVRSVSVASMHTCAVTNANRAYCWGYNANGQLGLGHTTSPQTSPQPVVAVAGLGTSEVASIQASPFGACAVSSSKDVYCWGYNADGQLGEGTTTSSTSPRPVTTSSGMPQGAIEHLATSTFGACAVDGSHDVWCWGDGSDGLMGDGTSAQDRVVPTQTIRLPEGVTVAAIALARYAFNPSLNPWMGCVLTTAGQPWCWRTGDNVTIARSMGLAAPSLMTPPSGRTWAQMTAGWSHSCALDTTATVWCWGDNEYGQLGSGDTVSSLEPRQVVGLGAVATISAAGASTCALTTAGTAFCWGPNWSGELGTGDRTERLSPTPVSVSALPVQTFTAISVSEYHTCALDAVRRAWCWGENGNRQLGTGDQIDRLSPTAVTTGAGPAPDFVQVTTNGGHTCALDTLQRAWCWGYNGQGQLGISSTVSQAYPTLVTVSAFTSIAAGDSHTCGLTPVGVVYCWGYNVSGQLGLGDTTQRTEPVPVAGLDDVAVIASGYRRSCAATRSGEAWCWGEGDFGALGTASSDDHSTPVSVVTTSGLSTRAVIGFALADGHSWFLTAVQSPQDGGDSDPSEDTPAEPPSDSPTADSGPSVDPAPAAVTSRLEVVAGRARAEVTTPLGALQFDFRGLRDTDSLTVTVTALDEAAPPPGALAVGPRYRITVQTPFDTVEVCVPVDTALLQLTGPRRDRLRLVRTSSDGLRHDITTYGEVGSDPRQLCGRTDRFSDVQAVVLASDRLAGDDRFATARAVASTDSFSGASTLYVTRVGDPVAPLAAVMAAGRSAPLLLTAGPRWPADTRRAVRAHAAAQVETVSGGDDLAAASAAWAVSRHPEGADIVFVASATSASDAVIAAATAAGLDAGVLLVDPQRVGTVSLEALRTLAPQRIVLIGGTSVLPAAVTRQLRAFTGATVERIAGVDRTDTSLRVAHRFPRPGGVVVAGGRQLADALVAAPLAAATNANLILTGSASASNQLVDSLTRLAPPAMTLVGGDRAISPTAELRLSNTIG